MAQKVSINGSYSIVNNGNTIPRKLTSTLTMSGSLFNVSSMTVATGSWQVIDQNKNVDFRSGVLTNNDTVSFIKYAVGNTGSFLILWPGDTNIISYSGSATLWAQATPSASLLTYMQASFN